MNLNYLIRDYRMDESQRGNPSGIHLGTAPSTNFAAMSDEEYEKWCETDHEYEPRYWVWEGDRPLFGVRDAISRGIEERPLWTTHSFEGRKFVVGYYHDGQPMTTREIDS